LGTLWVPFEIRYATDECKIPIIAAYPGRGPILEPGWLSHLWPEALAKRIHNGFAHVIYILCIPYLKSPLAAAVGTFSYNQYPNGGGLGYYSREAYQFWGLLR